MMTFLVIVVAILYGGLGFALGYATGHIKGYERGGRNIIKKTIEMIDIAKKEHQKKHSVISPFQIKR